MTSVFHIAASQAQEINVPVTGNTATVIVDATESVLLVPWFEVNLHTTDTPNLTVDIYDGTNARYLGDDAGDTYNAVALVAKKSKKFTQGYVIPVGSQLRVTSSNASGQLHVHGLVAKTY